MKQSLTEWEEEWQAMFQLHSVNPGVEKVEKWNAEKLQFLKLHNNPEVSTTIIELSGGKVELHIGMHTKWLAHEAIQLNEPGNFGKLSDLTHKDDRIFSLETELMAYEIMMSLPANERNLFWAKYHRRLRDKTEEYIYYILVITVYESDTNNNPWLLRIETKRLPKGYQPEKIHYRDFSHSLKTGKKEKPALKNLSAREKEILELAHEGFHTIDIAEELGISHHTVKNIRKKILKKLRAENTNMAYEVAKKQLMI